MERKLLKKFRNDNNLTQEQMAKKLDISLSHYKQIEIGEKNPSLKLLKKMALKFPTMDIDIIFLH